MLYYDRINTSERIEFAKSNNSKECMIFHYWFFNYGFKFQDSGCNACHVFTMLSLYISNISISLLKMFIIPALFITLTNLKQLIY